MSDKYFTVLKCPDINEMYVANANWEQHNECICGKITDVHSFHNIGHVIYVGTFGARNSDSALKQAQATGAG